MTSSDKCNDEPFLLKVSRPPTTSNRPKSNHSQTSPLRSRVLYVKENKSRKASSFIPPQAMNHVKKASHPSVRPTVFSQEVDYRYFSGPFAYFKENIATKKIPGGVLSSANRFQYEMQTKTERINEATKLSLALAFRKPVKSIARHGVGPHKLHAHDMYSNIKKNKRQNARACAEEQRLELTKAKRVSMFKKTKKIKSVFRKRNKVTKIRAKHNKIEATKLQKSKEQIISTIDYDALKLKKKCVKLELPNAPLMQNTANLGILPGVMLDQFTVKYRRARSQLNRRIRTKPALQRRLKQRPKSSAARVYRLYKSN